MAEGEKGSGYFLRWLSDIDRPLPHTIHNVGPARANTGAPRNVVSRGADDVRRASPDAEAPRNVLFPAAPACPVYLAIGHGSSSTSLKGKGVRKGGQAYFLGKGKGVRLTF